MKTLLSDRIAFRHCRAKSVTKTSAPDLKKFLLGGVGTERRFFINASAIPSEVETSFAIQVDARNLLIGIHAAALPKSTSRVSLELLFGGETKEEFTQMLLVEGESPSFFEFITGPKSRDSAHRRLRPSRIEWQEEVNFRAFRDVFVFLWFPKKQIFAHGPQVGFNVVRNERAFNEFSSWNLLAGNGSPDSQSLGTLLAPETEPPAPPRFTSKPSQSFALQMTNDVMMCVLGKPYTPDRLRGEMKFLRERKVSRLSWIDYAGNAPLHPERIWTKGWQESLKACGGEPLRLAAKAAEKEGVELVVDYKLFDFAFNNYADREGGKCGIRLHDNLYASCAASLVDKQDWFVQSNAEWCRPRRFPFQTLRFFSRQPLPAASNDEIKLLVSEDNLAYRPYAGAFSAKVERIRRPHTSWSPAGPVPSQGTESCFLLEISGLDLKEPFVLLQWDRAGAQLTNLKFRLSEAVDADGEVHLLPLSNRRTGESVSYQPDWSGWGNLVEGITAETTVSLNDIGLCLKEKTSLPGFLEVSHPEVHAFWLSGLEKLFDDGAKAVCLRVLAHHYTTDSWLNFAFHPIVIQQFRERFHRDPLPQEDDYSRIRALRGEAFTKFLRQARALARKRKCRLMIQLESGAELPSKVGTRLQFNYELETWIQEKLVDEFVVRGLSPWAPWLRQWLIPRSQKAGLPVHWVTRNLGAGSRIALTRQADILAANATAARKHGFSGISLYESMAFYWPNAAGRIVPLFGAEELFRKIAEAGKV